MISTVLIIVYKRGIVKIGQDAQSTDLGNDIPLNFLKPSMII